MQQAGDLAFPGRLSPAPRSCQPEAKPAGPSAEHGACGGAVPTGTQSRRYLKSLWSVYDVTDEGYLSGTRRVIDTLSQAVFTTYPKRCRPRDLR